MENTKNIFFVKKWSGQEVSEGDGAIVFRIIGIKQMPDIDPFLMLDFFQNSTLPSGFPDHPHRGFETVTYIVQGKILHEDFKGHKGEIAAGDIQWMTAGKGIVHAEMPYSFNEPTSGFQLWINLPRTKKKIEPKYQEFKKNKIPIFENKDKTCFVKIIAGKFENLVGPVIPETPVCFFEIILEKNSEVSLEIEKGKKGFALLFEGNNLEVNSTQKINCLESILFESKQNGSLKFENKETKCRFLVIYGSPLNEPVVKYGPFVMNTEDEIEEAIEDYKKAKNGFENRIKWKSQIQFLAKK